MKLIQIQEAEDGDVEHRKELSEQRFLALLKAKARGAHTVVKQAPLFKEDKGADFMLVTPSAGPAKSPFWVDKLVDGQGQWSAYPKRLGSLKARTSLDSMRGKDDAYAVIPVDHAKLGVAPGTSFFRSFEAASEGMGVSRLDNDGIRTWLQLLVDGLNVETPAAMPRPEPETFAQLITAMGKFDKALKEHRPMLTKQLKSDDRKLSGEAERALVDLLSRHITTVERYLSEKLEPEANGFTSIHVEGLPAYTTDREIWTMSPCLLIKRSKYIELHERGDLK